MKKDQFLFLAIIAGFGRPSIAAACSHRCDVPAAAIVAPRSGSVASSGVEVVVSWRGRPPDELTFGAIREQIFLETSAGEPVPVTYAHEPWANGLTSTLLMRPQSPLPEGEYRVRAGQTPFKEEEVLSTFTVSRDETTSPIMTSEVMVSGALACENNHRGLPACCYGDEREYLRVDLGLDGTELFSVMEGETLLASHVSPSEAWGIAINPGVMIESCSDFYYPWHLTRERHSLTIVPYRPDGTARTPFTIDVDAAGGSGGCAVNRRQPADAAWASVLFFLAGLPCARRLLRRRELGHP